MAISGQQKMLLDWIAERGSVSRDAPWTIFRFRGGPHKSLSVLRRLGLISFDEETLRWSITEAGKARAESANV